MRYRYNYEAVTCVSVLALASGTYTFAYTFIDTIVVSVAFYNLRQNIIFQSKNALMKNSHVL